MFKKLQTTVYCEEWFPLDLKEMMTFVSGRPSNGGRVIRTIGSAQHLMLKDAL